MIIQRGTAERQAAEEIAARASLAEAAETEFDLTLPAPGLRGFRSAAPQVNGIIQTEERPGEHQTTERPRYE